MLPAVLPYCALLCLLTGGAAIKIQEFSVPGAAHAGDAAELRCRAGPGEPLLVKWWWTALGPAAATRQLYQRFSGQAPQALVLNGRKIEYKDNDTLVLRALRPADSGLFECETTAADAAEDRSRARLVVFTEGSGPVLNVTSEAGADPGEEDLLITCSAHGVAPKPDITITINGEAAAAAAAAEAAGAGGLFNITATARARAPARAALRCELFYEDADISHPAYYVDLEVLAGSNDVTTESESEVTDSNTEPLGVEATDRPAAGGAGGAGAGGLMPACLLTVALAFFYR